MVTKKGLIAKIRVLDVLTLSEGDSLVAAVIIESEDKKEEKPSEL